MQKEEEIKVNKEICFLIAKFLKNQYPEVGDTFIRECEKYKLFPSSVFVKDPSYEKLCSSLYPTVPSNQLLKLLQIASPAFKYPSVLRPLSSHKSNLHESAKKKFRPLKRIISHSFLTYCMQIDKTSQILILNSDNSIIKVWKLPELSLINSFLEHETTITDIQIHPSNQYFASSDDDGLVCIFSLLASVCIYKTKFDCCVHSLNFSANGEYLSISTEKNGLIFIKNVLSKNPKVEFIQPKKCSEVWWCQNSPDPDYSFFVLGETSLYNICISTNEISMVFESSQSFGNISVSKIDKYRIICQFTSQPFFVVLTGSTIDLPNRSTLSINKDDVIIDIQHNCDETLIIALTKRSGIYAWNMASLQLVFFVNNITYFDNCNMFIPSPIDPYIVCVSNDCQFLSFWDLSKSPIKHEQNVDISLNKKLFTVSSNQSNENKHLDPISSISVNLEHLEGCWSPDGQSIVISDDDKGFTLFRQTLDDVQCQAEHQYLLKERDKVEKAIWLYSSIENDNDTELPIMPHFNNGENHQSNEINDSGNIMVDNNWIPMNPQPKRFSIHELNFRIQIQ